MRKLLKLVFTDEEGNLFEWADGATSTIQMARAAFRQGLKLDMSSGCSNWDLSAYLSRDNEDALREWLNAREEARLG